MIEISNDAVVEVLHELQDEGAALGTVVGMAIFGGIVSWLRQKGPRKFSRLVVVLCTAGFAGLVAYYLTNAVGLNDQYQCAISGIAGYGGGTLLDECVDNLREFLHSKNRNKKP